MVRGYPALGIRETRRKAVNQDQKHLYDYCRKQRTELAEERTLLENGTVKSQIRTSAGWSDCSLYKIADIRHQLAILESVINRLEADQSLD
jgi:uncharacterized small protein (DUF1192 family)